MSRKTRRSRGAERSSHCPSLEVRRLAQVCRSPHAYATPTGWSGDRRDRDDVREPVALYDVGTEAWRSRRARGAQDLVDFASVHHGRRHASRLILGLACLIAWQSICILRLDRFDAVQSIAPAFKGSREEEDGLIGYLVFG